MKKLNSRKRKTEKYLFDTNILLKVPAVLRDFSTDSVISKTVFEELDYRKKTPEHQENAQLAIKHISEWGIPILKTKFGNKKTSNDEKILLEALESEFSIVIVSDDNGMKVRATEKGLECIDYQTFQKRNLAASDVPTPDDIFLYNLVDKGKFSEAKNFLESRRVNPNFIKKDNYTPLIFFVRHRQYEKMLFWVSLPGCDLNKYDSSKFPMPPFIHAAQRGWLKGLKFLVENGANTALLSRGKNKGNSALLIAVWDNRFDIVKFLIEKRELEISINQADSNGFTPIIKAAIKGHEKIARYLLKQPEIDLKIRDRIGKSALDYAVEKNHSSIARL